MIPVNLIDRVEVVTGRRFEPQYGSDAVAGVVNFILKDRLQGFRANVQGGISDEGDGRNYAISLAYGTSFATMTGPASSSARPAARTTPVKNQYQRDWGAKTPARSA